jgi:Flp pilus assembly protein protease CpaA
MLLLSEQPWIDLVSLYCAIFFSLTIAWIDHRTMIIPNRWVYSFAVVSLLLAVTRTTFIRFGSDHLFQGFPAWPTFAEAVLGSLIGFLFTLYFWNRGWMGGGDVKLALALGLCVGYQRILHVLLLTHVFALFIPHAAGYIDRILGKSPQNGLQNIQDKRVSMGPFYAAALLMVLW